MNEKDLRYINDNGTINCPFCERNKISIRSIGRGKYDVDKQQRAYIYFTECAECGKVSIHFSYEDLDYTSYNDRALFKFDPIDYQDEEDIENIDDLFFAHTPSSKFVPCDDIPASIRTEISAADQSQSQNLLTGGSASVRKAIYLTLKDKKSIVKNNEGKTNYQESLKQLKSLLREVDPHQIDFLSNLKELADDQVHEDSWPGFDGKTLKYCIEVLKQVVFDIYARPAQRKRDRQRLEALGVSFKKSKQGF